MSPLAAAATAALQRPAFLTARHYRQDARRLSSLIDASKVRAQLFARVNVRIYAQQRRRLVIARYQRFMRLE